MKRISFLLALFCLLLAAKAQAPEGYYDAATGTKGTVIKTALYQIIASHTQRSYADLWEDFKQTDVRDDGFIWDMYSATTSYVPGGSAQGHNYKQEGDSYNREHSFPKSWFDDAYPMYSDLMHLVPTDGYVNGRRSNYPYGETSSPTWSSNEGWSRLGPSSISGYSGTVFEPNDEYKGDFARIYFYMATAYETQIASWSSPMLSGNAATPFTSWALQMLLRWAQEDPVSQKEIDRNNAVYAIQHNRNPFVDFPGLEQYVWGSKTSLAFDPANFDGTNPDDTKTKPEAPVFSQEGGVVEEGYVLTITCPTAGVEIYYSIDGEPNQIAYPPVSIVINQTQTISAYAVLDGVPSEEVTYRFILDQGQSIGENVYTLVTDESELVAGGQYLIVCAKKQTALADQNGNYRTAVDVTVDGTSITTEVSTIGFPYLLTLEKASAGWQFYDATSAVWLGLTSSSNHLNALTEPSEETQFTVKISSDGTATISPVVSSRTNRRIQYNASAPRFACYTGSQQEVNLFRAATATGVQGAVLGGEPSAPVFYDLQGRRVAKPARGMYIVNGKKVWVEK